MTEDIHSEKAAQGGQGHTTVKTQASTEVYPTAVEAWTELCILHSTSGSGGGMRDEMSVAWWHEDPSLCFPSEDAHAHFCNPA